MKVVIEKDSMTITVDGENHDVELMLAELLKYKEKTGGPGGSVSYLVPYQPLYRCNPCMHCGFGFPGSMCGKYGAGGLGFGGSGGRGGSV
jgi:hypothetical protein